MNDLGILPFTLLLAAGIDLLLIIAVLKIHRESIRRIGLHWNRWKSNIAVGLAVVPLLLVVNMAVIWIFQAYLPQYYTEVNPLTENVRTFGQLCLFIITAIFAGGIQEELQRAFILDRFDRYLGGAGVGLVLWSIAFGLNHYVQGAQGIVTAGIFSIIFGSLFLIRRSLLGPIVAHSIYNALILLGYWSFR